MVDPAYPSDRQKIYLDVARPKALIVIAKASREEGRLSPDVEAFIESNLNLRTRIPALELLDDGDLVGGSLQEGSSDVLGEEQKLKDRHPGVIVGPDTQPTLSFTSGSEGIPKGCKYVLVYLALIMHRLIEVAGDAGDPCLWSCERHLCQVDEC